MTNLNFFPGVDEDEHDIDENVDPGDDTLEPGDTESDFDADTTLEIDDPLEEIKDDPDNIEGEAPGDEDDEDDDDDEEDDEAV